MRSGKTSRASTKRQRHSVSMLRVISEAKDGMGGEDVENGTSVGVGVFGWMLISLYITENEE
jgi:hypothetical protein